MADNVNAAAVVEALVQDVRLTEKLIAAMKNVALLAPATAEIIAVDQEVAPELLAACEHAREAMLAIERAIEFIHARMEVRHGKLG